MYVHSHPNPPRRQHLLPDSSIGPARRGKRDKDCARERQHGEMEEGISAGGGDGTRLGASEPAKIMAEMEKLDIPFRILTARMTTTFATVLC